MKKHYVIAMAMIALAGVFSGGAFAAATLTGRDIRNSSLTGADIRNGSLTEQELSGAVRTKLNRRSTPADPLPGPQGPAGPQGPQGPPGPSNIASMTRVFGTENAVSAGQVGSSVAVCPSGMRVVSGGGFFFTGNGAGISDTEATDDRTAWFVIGGNSSAVEGSTQAFAMCAPVGSAVASGRPRPGRLTPRARRQIERHIARAEQRVFNR